MPRSVFAFLFATAALISAGSASRVQVAQNQTVVVGLSSGGFMSVQIHVAFSASLAGAGVIAGGPFYCAKGDVFDTEACMGYPELLDVQDCISAANDCASANLCDPLSSLAAGRVYLFSGTKDSLVKQGVMKKAKDFYLNYMPQSLVDANFTVPAEHSWPTANWGNGCGTLASPYINNCGADISEQMMASILGGVAPPVGAHVANLATISQDKYAPGGSASAISLGPKAYVYTPSACKSSTCRLVIAFHGCEQTIDDVGLDFVAHVGMNELAEANNWVVLYPQAIRSYVEPSNPDGCFDWWGYTDGNYANKRGPQMATVRAMWEALESGLAL